MLPSQALQNFHPGGSTHQGLVEDIATRSLQSVRVGEGAGKINTGLSMAFVGYEAGKYHQSGSFGTFVGFQAGFQNTSASYGTFVGAFAGAQNERGDDNTFVGFRTGEQNTSGSECVAAGAYAMRYNASGNASVAVGYAAGERCIDGSFNTMIGALSGQDNRSGSYNTMAGYKSGRSAFQGNYNTYFGAYAGYSNYHGDANCFIGYRSGESLSDGNLNIAIGAYSMAFASQGDSNIAIGPYSAFYATGSGNVFFGQNAGASNYTGDFNVIVGVNAGLSNIGSKNVIAGESAALTWRGDCNVLLGAEVAPEGSGFQNVIIGFRAASGNYRAGNNNIFIGDGTDATQSNVNNAISIGTTNVSTTNNSIAIGENIENTGLHSVSVGFSITTNAQNSVLVGEALAITSATYFNDPLNLQTVAIIQSDAYLKFGISNILYSNGVLGTQASPFATAEFGYNTSNLYATTTAPRTYPRSPSQYTLSTGKNYFALTYGCNLFYTDPSCNTAPAFLQTLGAATASNCVFASLPVAAGAVSPPPIATYGCNAPLADYASNASVFHSTVQFTNVGIGTTFIHNVFTTNTFSLPYTLSIPKNHVKPYFVPPSVALEPPGAAGVFLSPTESNLIVLRPPRYGTLSSCLTASSASPIFPDYITPSSFAASLPSAPSPYLFASNDSYSVLPSVYLYDAASNLIGISSNADTFYTCNLTIPASLTPVVLTPRPFALDASVLAAPLPLTRNELVYARYGTWAATSNITLAGFDPAFLFSNVATATSYTCNQALTVPAFSPTTYTLDLTVDFNTSNFVVQGGTGAPFDSNTPLYIGHTYIFQQYDTSNLNLPLRFASAPDGLGGTDYTSNVVFAGTPGTDGTSTILITPDTPNPLYYYASNQIGYGSSNAIFPIPTAPLSLPYHSVLSGSNFLYLHPASNLPATPEPFRLTAAGSNLEIPMVRYSTQSAGLWENTETERTSQQTLLTPLDALAFPLVSNVDYTSLYIESAPTYGRFSGTTYTPLDPWRAHTDTVSFFLGNSQNRFKRFTWTIQTTPGSTLYQNPTYWIQTPIAHSNVSSSNVFTTYTTSNTPIYHEITYTSNLVPPVVVYESIGSYDPTVIGQKIVQSNQIQLNTLEILPGAGSNTTIEIWDTSNIDISFASVSNITTACNVSVQTTGYDIPHSNLVYTYYQINTTLHRRLYDSNYDVYSQWADTSNVYDALRGTYLYTYGSNTVYGLSNFMSSNELTAGASVQTYGFSNYDIVRVFHQDRPVLPLVKTALYQSNTVFYTAEDSYYRALRSNVGPVSQFTTDALVAGEVYLESKGVVVPPEYRFTVSGGASGALSIPYFTSNVSLSAIVLPDFAARSPAKWWLMNSNAQAWIHPWETDTRPGLSLGFTPTHLYLPKLRHGGLIDPTGARWTHRIPLGGGAGAEGVYYQASGLYDHESIEFFYANETTGQVSPLYQQSIFLRFPPSLTLAPSLPLYAFSSQLARWNPFTSNALYLTAPEAPASSLYYRFDIKNPSDPVDIYQWPSKTTQAQAIYSWSNLAAGLLYMTLKAAPGASVGSNILPYTVYQTLSDASTGLNVLDSGSLTVPLVPFYDFPQASSSPSGSSTLESIRFLQQPHCNVFYGAASNALFQYVDVAGTFEPSSVAFLTEPLSGGFLSKADFAYSNIVQNTVSYVPYDPTLVSNETVPYRWMYRGIASPSYSLDYRNYWFAASPQPIVPQRTYAPSRQVAWTDTTRFAPSAGWSNAVATGTLSVSPAVYVYPYHSNTRDLQTESITLTTPGTVLTSTLTFTPVAYAYPPRLLSQTLSVSVEQASSFSLSALVSPAVVAWDSNHANDLLVYLDQRPTQGVLTTTLPSSNVASWSYSELLSNTVFYQHLGGAALTDTFTIRYATHDYSVLPTALTVQIAVEPLPTLTTHRQDAIYALSSNEALATHYSLRNSMTFTTPVPNAAYLQVLSSSNLYTEYAGVACNVLPLAYMATDSNTYRLTPEYFASTPGGIYPPLGMQVALRTRPTDTHRLTAEPLYSNLIVHEWSGEFNRFTSCNALIPPLIASNEQLIDYQFAVQDSNYQDLNALETSFSFYTQPNTSLFPYASVAAPRQNSNALVLFDPYLDFAFSLQFLNSNAQTLCALDVSRSAVSVQLDGGGGAITHYPLSPFLRDRIVFNDYTYWSLVFNDPANQGGLSFYIQPNTALPNRDNQSVNVFKDDLLLPSLDALASVRLVSQANHPKNYYPLYSCNALAPGRDVFTDVFLSNYDHRLYFKNVELSSKLPTDIETEAYNIALGKNIQVKGEDNICFGTNFSALGKFSIIIGNNIGQSANFVNQIYESIIIGNTSFQGSVIRNVIAIGSQLMNNLYAGALPGLTDQVINQFISKRPILIGNDIGPEKVDYHVNVANTVLRTSVGNTSNLDQIYLGNAAEIVAVGYTSNASLQGPAQLFVQGDIQADAIQYHFAESPDYGTPTAPVNGGSFTIDCDRRSRVLFELSSNVPSATPLSLHFTNLSRHIGKELDLIFIERSSVARAFTVGTNIKFATARPTLTTPGGIDRLQCLIVQSNLALGTWTPNAAAF